MSDIFNADAYTGGDTTPMMHIPFPVAEEGDVVRVRILETGEIIEAPIERHGMFWRASIPMREGVRYVVEVEGPTVRKLREDD